MIYSLTAFSFFLLSIYLWRTDSTQKTRLVLVLAMVWLTLHDGLRWEIGTDWNHYYDCFIYDDNEHMGITYRFLNSLCRLFTDSYTIFLLGYAAFTYFIIGKWLYKYSPNPLISVAIYYCSMMGLMGSNRQLLAMVFCIISLRFIVKREIKWFIGIILFATTIHITAFSFIIAYFLYNHTYTNRKIYIITGISFMIGLLHIINQIPFVEYLALLDGMTNNTNTTSYLSEDFVGAVSLAGSFKRLLYVYLALHVRKYINDKEYDYFLLLYVIGACIYLIFNGSVLQILAGRGAAYFAVYECIVIAYVIMHAPFSFFPKLMTWLVLFMIYFFLMWRDMNSYYLLDGIDIYNPYKCVLF